MTHRQRSSDWWDGYEHALADVEYTAANQKWPEAVIKATHVVTARIRQHVRPFVLADMSAYRKREDR